MKLKNKDFIYVVLRHDFSGNDVVCCACLTPERADELVGEYSQMFKDKGFTDECYFYANATTFYAA